MARLKSGKVIPGLTAAFVFLMLRQVLLGILIVESPCYSFASGCPAGAPIASLKLTVLPVMPPIEPVLGSVPPSSHFRD